MDKYSLSLARLSGISGLSLAGDYTGFTEDSRWWNRRYHHHRRLCLIDASRQIDTRRRPFSGWCARRRAERFLLRRAREKVTWEESWERIVLAMYSFCLSRAWRGWFPRKTTRACMRARARARVCVCVCVQCIHARARMHAHLHRRRKQTSEVVGAEREGQKEHEAATAAAITIAADRRQRCARLRSCAGGRSNGGARGVERRNREDPKRCPP